MSIGPSYCGFCIKRLAQKINSSKNATPFYSNQPKKPNVPRWQFRSVPFYRYGVTNGNCVGRPVSSHRSIFSCEPSLPVTAANYNVLDACKTERTVATSGYTLIG